MLVYVILVGHFFITAKKFSLTAVIRVASFAFREVSRVEGGGKGGGGGGGINQAGHSPMEQPHLSVAPPLSKAHR